MQAKKELLTKVLYQVFVRDYPPHGTLRDVKDDLKRIHDLGADILYLMPIQTIGKVGRKGSLGSPYAIEDYGEIDPSLGTEEDFKKLCEKAHLLGMKVILDVVYNHTARDSVLLKEHPEYFYKDKDGNFGNKAGAWSDVYDLDHSKEGLDDLLVSYLLKYQGLGIDGFRFDVASLLPSSFYWLAREKLGEECIFLAECIDTDFLNFLRSKGVRTLTNAELVESGIDFLYPYASFAFLENYLLSLREEDLSSALVALKLEEATIPQDHFLTRCVENHDRRRINSYHDSPLLARNLLAFTISRPSSNRRCSPSPSRRRTTKNSSKSLSSGRKEVSKKKSLRPSISRRKDMSFLPRTSLWREKSTAFSISPPRRRRSLSNISPQGSTRIFSAERKFLSRRMDCQ